MFNQIFKVLWVVLIPLISSGCSNVYSDALMSFMPVIDYINCYSFTTIKIRSSKCTNNGAPFYVVVKETDFPTFLTDDYPKIANLVTNPPDDQACFAVYCVVPGKDLTVTIDTPEVQSIGVYFLLTNPGESWRDFVMLKEGCTTVRFALENNHIVSIEK